MAIELVAPEDGEYLLQLSSADFEATLQVLDDCESQSASCPLPGDDGVVTRPLRAGESVIVVVDGAHAAAAGSFVLEALRIAEAEERCDDGLDDDLDGRADCDDPDCSVECAIDDDTVTGEPRGELEVELDDLAVVEICDDGIDNDGNGEVDCSDPACALSELCHEDCSDGIDNDGDGDVDCLDRACGLADTCIEVCGDGIDNDGDCEIDCGDVGCTGHPDCVSSCTDADAVLAVPTRRRGNLTGLSNDVELSCSEGGGSDYTIAFTAPRTGTYVFDAAGSAFSAAIALFDGCGGPELACSGSGAGEQGHAGTLVRDLQRGQTVMVVVDRALDPSGSSTCGDEPALAHLGEPGSFQIHIAEATETETACGQNRDLDGDGLLGCADPDCADTVLCRVQGQMEHPIESMDPACVKSGRCDGSTDVATVVPPKLGFGSVEVGWPSTANPPSKYVSEPEPPPGAGASQPLVWTGDDPPSGPTINVAPAQNQWSGPSATAGEPRFPIDANAGMQRGAYRDMVSIQVPPGPNGMTPQLSIVHNHNARDTGVGMGFVLNAPPGIRRESTHGGPPNQTAEGTSRFVLGGELLVYDVNWVWVPQNRDGRRFVYDDISNTFTCHFADGSTMVYGTIGFSGSTGENGTIGLYHTPGRARRDGDPAANYGAPHPTTIGTNDPATHASFLDCTKNNELCNTAAWLPTLHTDAVGNEVVYNYEIAPGLTNPPAGADYWYGNSRRHQLSSIEYGYDDRASIEFVYEEHPFPEMSMSTGVPTFLTQRLTDIEVFSGSTALGPTEVHSYRLTYRDDVDPSEDLAGSYLHSIEIESGALRNPIRTFDYWFEDPSWEAVGTDITSDFDFDFSPARVDGWDNEDDAMMVLPMNMNGDGRSDLMVLRRFCTSSNNCVFENKQAVAGDDGHFDITDPDGQRWSFPDNWYSGEQFLTMDLDGDGYTEWIEKSGNLTTISRLDPYEDVFYTATFPLDYEIVSHSSPVDINGDGCTDLVRTQYVNGGLVSEWYRNMCVDPYFDANDPIPLDWQQAFEEDWELHAGEDWLGWPEHFDNERNSPPWTFTDVNRDGLADLVVSLFMEWRPHQDCTNPSANEVCRFVPQDGTEAFSRIYWGDGYGGFVDSGLQAGAPLVMEIEGTQATRDRTTRSMWTVRSDLNGVPWLVGSRQAATDGGQMDVFGSRWDGIRDGFPLQTFTARFQEQTAGVNPFGPEQVVDYEAPNELDLGLDGHSRGDTCFEDGRYVVMADFTGNGFADILEIHTDDTNPFAFDPPSTPCGEPVCFMLRKNLVEHHYGRLKSVQVPAGGTIDLEWGFSADEDLHDLNPDLPINAEVLTGVTGPDGEVSFRYGRGAFGKGRFAGFGVVERDRHDFVDSFGYYTTPQLEGHPLWKARYNYQGNLERADVWVYGHLDPTVGLTVNSTWGILPAVSHFNPLLRECIYEVESTGPSLDRLIERCHDDDLPANQRPSRSSIYAMAGIWRYPDLDPFYSSSAGHLARDIWADDDVPVTHVRYDQPGVDDVPHLLATYQPASPPSLPDLRWTPPSNVEVPPLLSLTDHADPANLPPEASGTGATAFVTSYRWDADRARQTALVHLRSGDTAADDYTEAYTDELVSGTANVYRVTEVLTHAGTPEAAGPQLSRSQVQSFSSVGVSLPAMELQCGGIGPLGERCVTVTSAYDDLGRRTSETLSFADGVAPRTTTWAFTGFCETEDVTLPSGATIHKEYNHRCQQTEEEKDGVETWWVYDDLGRTMTELVRAGSHPLGGDAAPVFTKTTKYDTDYTYIVDSGFLEPRSTTLSSNGDLARVYEDEWGRTTLVETCVGDDPINHICASGSPIRREWTGYSTLGQQIATAPPYLVGETVAATRLTLDGYERPIMTQAPAPTRPASPEWDTRYHYVAPHRDIDVEHVPVEGVVQRVVEIDRWHTLEEERLRDGDRLEYRTLDVSGLVTRAEAPPPERIRTFTYDEDMNLVQWQSDFSDVAVQSDDSITTMAMSESFTYNDAGEITTMTRRDGAMVVLDYDVAGRVIDKTLHAEVEQPDGSFVLEPWATLETLEYGFEGTRPYVTSTDRQGFWTKTVTISTGDLYVENSLGHQIEYRNHGPVVADAGGSRVEEIRHHGNNTDVHWTTYDTFGNLVARQTPEQGTTTYTYDGAGNRLTQTDADGYTNSFVYSFAGPVLQEYQGGFLVNEKTYDVRHRMATEEDEGGLRTLDYDVHDRMKRIRYGNPATPLKERTWQYQYLTDWPLTETLAPTSYPSTGATPWHHAYDGWGRKLYTTDPLGEVSHVDYDIMGNPRITTDEEGYRRIVRYDWSGEVTYEELAGRNTIQSTHDYYPPGAVPSTLDGLKVVTSTESDGATTTTYIDGLGREVREVRPDGTEIKTIFDGMRIQQVQFLASDGSVEQRTVHQYDAQTGRLTKVIGPYDPSRSTEAHPEKELGWTAAGRQAWIEFAGERTDFTYNGEGRPETETYLGMSRTITYETPPSGVGRRIASQTLAKSGGSGSTRTTTMEYDDIGRITEVETTEPGGRIVTHTFGDYDAFDNARAKQADTNDGTAIDTVETDYTYDWLGRLTSRSIAVNGGASNTMSFGYYDNGVLAWHEGDSGRRVEYEYAAPGGAFDFEIDRVLQDNLTVFEIEDHDAAGRPTEIHRPQFSTQGATTALSYDLMGRLDSQVETDEATGLENKRYLPVYNELGYLENSTQEHYGATIERSFTFYGAGYLASETWSDGATDIEYDYTVDDAGKRTATDRGVTIGGSTTNTVTTLAYTVDGLVDSVDGSGVTYNDWQEVTTNHDGSTIARDAMGLAIEVTVGTDSVELLRDADGLPVARIDTNGTRITQFNPFDPGSDPLEELLPNGDHLVFAQGPGAVQRALYDASGLVQTKSIDQDAWQSPLAEDDDQRESGTAFGVGSSPSAHANDLLGFAGMQAIPGTTDMHVARYRILDSVTGHFLRPDPLGFSGGDRRTVYAKANPVAYTDAMGLQACDDPEVVQISSITPIPFNQEPIKPLEAEDSNISNSFDGLNETDSAGSSSPLADLKISFDNEIQPWRIPCHYGRGWGCEDVSGSDGTTYDEGPDGWWDFFASSDGGADTFRADLTPRQRKRARKLEVRREAKLGRMKERLRKKLERLETRKGRVDARVARRLTRKAAKAAGLLDGEFSEEVIVEGHTRRQRRLMAKIESARFTLTNWSVLTGTLTGDLGFSNTVATIRALTDFKSYRALGNLFVDAIHNPETQQALLSEAGRALVDGLCPVCTRFIDYEQAATAETAEETESMGTRLGNDIQEDLVSMAIGGGIGYAVKKAAKGLKRIKSGLQLMRRVCSFEPDTLVRTPTGAAAIDALRVGDLVVGDQVDQPAKDWMAVEGAPAWDPGFVEAPTEGSRVLALDERTGRWSSAVVDDLPEGVPFFYEGEVFERGAHGVVNLGSATRSRLRMATARWREGRRQEWPRNADWVWLLGVEGGLVHLGDVREGPVAYDGWVFEVRRTNSGLQLRSEGEVLAEVEEAYSNRYDSVQDVVIDVDGQRQTLGVTANHPFYLPLEDRWEAIGTIEPGALLQTSGGGSASLVGQSTRPGVLEAYNLQVSGVHDYFVAETDEQDFVLVHNSCRRLARRLDRLAAAGKLAPDEVDGIKEAILHLKEGTVPGFVRENPAAKFGATFNNIGPFKLPDNGRRYREFDVRKAEGDRGRGTRRIVVSDNGHAYYTPVHYGDPKRNPAPDGPFYLPDDFDEVWIPLGKVSDGW